MADNEQAWRRTERMLPWLAVIFSAVAAIGGIWSAFAIQAQARIAADEAALNKQVALVRYCDLGLPSYVRAGDDILYLTGRDGSSDYTASAYLSDFAETIPKRVKSVLRCQFTNYSRVPLFDISFTFRATFHNGRTVKTEQNEFPFSALEPSKSRTVWIVNTDDEPVTVLNPDRARYVRFPGMAHYQDENLPSLITDSWTITRDHDPVEHLGQGAKM